MEYQALKKLTEIQHWQNLWNNIDMLVIIFEKSLENGWRYWQNIYQKKTWILDGNMLHC